ncbi:SCO0930 family lipoprotein [Streptomyces sp. TLI_146]|uniref:SCO0930 family lipoprotein n=1 Tax=Streptomyces sp. TLI_146 TaxID=1938858 RepID=UPI000C709EAB|nr:SCO0930 family lipoprotein [Streptomyces sp. TLI_146]PKV89084.1 putative lipoprotein with Yx(FWY)xxD motif [Streptomyces sp. TLI_146]
MATWRNASLAVTAAAVLALTATACGQDKGSASPKGQSVGNAAQAAGSGNAYGYGDAGYGSGSGTANQAAAKAAGQLAVWDSKELGKVVTDSAGFTLYRFDKDTASPPKSNCDGDCAKLWPAVPAGSVTAAPGTDASLIGEVTRTDGSKQLTLAGWPMYRYTKDTKPGDATGEGVGGTWHASAPDGKKATPSADSAGAGGGAETPSLPGLSVREDPKLGKIIVDSRGMTVYRFKKDSAWPMKSACTGDCLKKWPVVAPVDKKDTEGIIQKGFVTFNRPDGIKQQSVNCWPIYTYAGDSKPGDTNGQGVGGTWWAVSPEGKLIATAK